MPSRRRFLAVCSVGVSVTAGCLETIGAPAIPREERILDDRTTIEAGAYRAWDLSEPVRNASLAPVDESYVFSYEFTVEQGPDVTLAVTDTTELDRREQTQGQYKVFLDTRSHGQQGAKSERLSAADLDVLVADTQYIGTDTPSSTRDATTVHVEAYLNTPD
ncbi:hypothetical protein [Salinigranum halophilum]|uniref:hypothetical protein n=1 Tax=Salinigranum halophilum TaxID=2565931 RepID=UPI0010A80FBC|nr:hypothetical protein [Salinigranum halophilum]